MTACHNALILQCLPEPLSGRAEILSKSLDSRPSNRLNYIRIVDFIGAFIDGVPPNPRHDLSLAYLLNFAVDDLKAYYYEAAAAQPGSVKPTAADLDDWFWGQTFAAKVLLAVKDRCLQKKDNTMQLLGKILLMPMSQSGS